MSILKISSRSNDFQQFLRFATVGIGGTLLDFSILSVLKFSGLPTLPANTISYLAGVINNFYWNRRWTFSTARSQVWQRQFVIFAFFSLVGLLINNTIMLFLDAPFAHLFGDMGYVPAKLLATAVVFFWNYSSNRLWTFRSPH